MFARSASAEPKSSSHAGSFFVPLRSAGTRSDDMVLVDCAAGHADLIRFEAERERERERVGTMTFWPLRGYHQGIPIVSRAFALGRLALTLFRIREVYRLVVCHMPEQR